MVLQSIRDRLTGIIAIFIFAILIIPFAFVGVSSYFTSDAVNALAVVNDQEITISEYSTAFQNYRRRMQAQLGQAFDPELFDQAIIRRQYLEQMIDEELLAQVSLEAGLAVDNQTLALAIREIEGFQVDGEFNTALYQARLNAQGSTPKRFEAEMRASIVYRQFPVSIASSAIATQWELADYAALVDQKRAFKAVIVPAEPLVVEELLVEDVVVEEVVETADDAEVVAAEEIIAAEEVVELAPVEEEAVLAWFEENKGDYLSPEMIEIEYLELDVATMGGSVEPEEEVLKGSFEEQKVRFVTPESRLASHILLEVDTAAAEVDVESAREQAEELAERARAGEDFAALAIEFSQDIGSSADGGDLGWVEPGFMVQAFEDGLYNLPAEGSISDPIQTGFGFHVIYLREIRPSEGMTYTEAREILVAEYRVEADERRYLEQADRLVDIIYEDPTTLDAAAQELGLEVMTAGPFGRSGDSIGISGNMEVVNTAFSDLVLAQGLVSDPVGMGDNHIVLVRMKEHLPETQLPLEDVRDQVVESIRSQRAMEAASVRAEELLASLIGGTDIVSLAETSGLELIEQEAATRNAPQMEARLRREVFLLPKPAEDGPVRSVVALGDGYAVIQLDSVTDGEYSAEDALRAAQYTRRLSNGTASAEALGFVRMLREQSEIKIFEDKL
jgi:peptidyl-prolyl cis-trans isomerase D